MNKLLKINIPDGYEIDKEKSTFEEIVFKPIKNICYYTVASKLFSDNKEIYTISNYGIIHKNRGIIDPYNYEDKNLALSEKQLCKVLAINQLFNIAKYYNNNKHDCIKYIIKYNKYTQEYHIQRLEVNESYGLPVFYNFNDVQLVINNPNFKYILNKIYAE